jgi:hypothetical protein
MYRKFICTQLGNAHLKGFRYIIRACELYKEGLEMSLIYEKIADEYNTTPAAVNRDMRYYASQMKKDGTYKILEFKINHFRPEEIVAAIVYRVDEDVLEYGGM